MFYLPKLIKSEETTYRNLLLKKIRDALTLSTLSPAAKGFLTSARIKAILTDEPKDLMAHHDAILPLLSPGLSVSVYEEYWLGKHKQIARRSARERRLIRQYGPEMEKLKRVFDYDEFIMGHKITSFKLAKMLNRNTCTYCNRVYTTTIIFKDPKTGQVNNGTRVTRPNYDHWYAHGKYPILGLSLYNLIPSCTICNSSVKGAVDFSLSKHLHPYTNKPEQDFNFNYKSQSVNTNNVVIDVQSKSKSANTLAAFQIAEVYNEHSAYELKDLLELRYKYSDNYLDTLFNRTFKVVVSKKEAYRMIFGTEFEDIDHHKRPFSKFKKDILEKLGVKI
ncbi:MAG TPA: hypothetical protein VL125_08270 [Pelobium sp.]|nr:hypothetical protein [Pelobium sp.]